MTNFYRLIHSHEYGTDTINFKSKKIFEDLPSFKAIAKLLKVDYDKDDGLNVRPCLISDLDQLMQERS